MATTKVSEEKQGVKNFLRPSICLASLITDSKLTFHFLCSAFLLLSPPGPLLPAVHSPPCGNYAVMVERSRLHSSLRPPYCMCLCSKHSSSLDSQLASEAASCELTAGTLGTLHMESRTQIVLHFTGKSQCL
ncbi:hypothetical protein DNTS_015569 [Danionella cerebrum]|uniref:Uncharacterized protein n=1 Tax=Danionella cerebrum TaxID=2873325 RepID=A0A553NI10_9TELE|nr:hypothetical protein DNTS_015569 [Danionella translucida]